MSLTVIAAMFFLKQSSSDTQGTMSWLDLVSIATWSILLSVQVNRYDLSLLYGLAIPLTIQGANHLTVLRYVYLGGLGLLVLVV